MAAEHVTKSRRLRPYPRRTESLFLARAISWLRLSTRFDHGCAMPYDPDVHHRRSIRLPGFGYASAGAYFITVCTHQRELLFDDKRVRTIAWNAWHGLSRRFPSLRLDEFVIMPNHVHGIVWILDRTVVGAQRDANANHVAVGDSLSESERVFPLYQAAPKRAQRDAKTKHVAAGGSLPGSEHISALYQAAPLRPAVAPRSLGAIVRALKSVSAKRINRLRGTPSASVWQRNYYERVIRNEDELSRIRQYILDNRRNGRMTRTTRRTGAGPRRGEAHRGRASTTERPHSASRPARGEGTWRLAPKALTRLQFAKHNVLPFDDETAFIIGQH